MSTGPLTHNSYMTDYTIPTLDNDTIRVSPYCIQVGQGGPSGTLYYGDAELIQDYLANPSDDDLDIYGCIHHINLHREGEEYRFTINFMGHVGSLRFGESQARDFIFALAFANPSSSNPNR